MLVYSAVHRRRGTTLIECAIIYPLAFLFILGLIIGGLGIFRYQQVAHLARAAVRYAAVRGGQYRTETGQTNPNEQAIRNYVVGQSAALKIDPASLNVQVFHNITTASGNNNVVTTVPWDSSAKAPNTVTTDNGQARQNTVTVTVTYQWVPEAFLAGPITLTSTATIPMQY